MGIPKCVLKLKKLVAYLLEKFITRLLVSDLVFALDAIEATQAHAKTYTSKVLDAPARFQPN
jgi:hypothetical protein